MTHKTYNPAYDGAFGQYLRYGTPITEPYYLEDKDNHKDTNNDKDIDKIPKVYVWRTRGDKKVRSSHRENDGKVFTRDNPPHTGHPGQGYNCRCIAEPYVRGIMQHVSQTIISDLSENPKKWGNQEFWDHFQLGKGRTVTLAETGHLRGVIDYYFYDMGVMEKVNQQIIQQAIEKKTSAYLEYKFENSYKFGGIKKLWNDGKQYMYCFGGSIIKGIFRGNVTYYINDIIAIDGIIEYEYFDIFTDPGSARESVNLVKKYLKLDISDSKEVNPTWRAITDLEFLDCIAYNIVDRWTTRFKAEIPHKTSLMNVLNIDYNTNMHH